jgi:hypothetical protein
MPDFGIFRGFNEKLFADKLYAGQLPTELGLIGSGDFNLQLLDTYSGAAAAYSLRKLRTAYTGNAIRVRRASDNTEQNIGFVNNELDTASLTSFCSGTNGFVTTWYDQSGNARNATQTTAASQPQIVSSGSVILENGKPTIQFDGTNDMLTFNTLTFNPTYTHALVLKCNTTSGVERVVFSGVNNANSTLKYLVNTSKYVARYASPTTDYLINTTFAQELVFLYRNNSQIQASLNNSLFTNATYYSNSVSIYNIGNTPFLDNAFNGNLQEIIIYNTDQSTNLNGINTNINDFYSIY